MPDALCGFDVMMEAIRSAVEEAMAKLGLTVNGEVRGIVQVTGMPESGNGFRVQIGDGIPKGWVK